LSNEPLNYNIVRPYLEVNLLPNRIKKDVKASIGAEYIYEYREFSRPQFGIWINEIPPIVIDEVTSNIGRLTFNFSKKMLRSDMRWKSSVDLVNTEYKSFQSSNNAIIHQHTFNYDYIYRGKGKKAVRTRLYYGSGGDDFFLSASGQTGRMDYAYDGLFLGRSETQGLLSNQFMRNQGGLAVPTRLTANKHLASLNVDFDLPVRFPLSIYAGAAYVVKDYSYLPYLMLIDSNEFIWNAGVSVPIIRNIFQIYVPVIYSSQIKDEFKARDLNFGETIMFELNLNMANPFEILKRLEL